MIASLALGYGLERFGKVDGALAIAVVLGVLAALCVPTRGSSTRPTPQ